MRQKSHVQECYGRSDGLGMLQRNVMTSSVWPCVHMLMPLHTTATLSLQEDDDAYSKNELLLDYPAMAVLS